MPRAIVGIGCCVCEVSPLSLISSVFLVLYSNYISCFRPQHQLDTFRAWAGKSSDISYYLNSHHVDFQEWANMVRGNE